MNLLLFIYIQAKPNRIIAKQKRNSTRKRNESKKNKYPSRILIPHIALA